MAPVAVPPITRTPIFVNPVTTPVERTEMAPVPLLTALMPVALPVTAAAVTMRSAPLVASRSMPTPRDVPMAATVPLASTATSPVPLPTALIPTSPPVTDATSMVREAADETTASIPAWLPTTAPVAAMSSAPAPADRARIPVAPVTDATLIAMSPAAVPPIA